MAFDSSKTDDVQITGRELAGRVAAVGSEVTEFKPGDLVWASTYYRDRRAGCFQSYVIVPQHTIDHVPSSITLQQASTLGVCGLTAAMVLWHWFEIPIPEASTVLGEHAAIVIWGGATVTGQFLVQLARISGLEVIAVCSEASKDLVKSLGANHVISRDSLTNESIKERILDLGLPIKYVVDAANSETAQVALGLVKERGGSFAAIAEPLPKDVTFPDSVSVKGVQMKWFVLHKQNSIYQKSLTRLVKKGLITFPTIKVLPGLDWVEEGLRRLQKSEKGGRGGVKYVVQIA